MPQCYDVEPLEQLEQVLKEMIRNKLQDNFRDLEDDGDGSHDDQVGRNQTLDIASLLHALHMPYAEDGEQGQQKQQLPQKLSEEV